MTPTEFSNEFDTLAASYKYNPTYGEQYFPAETVFNDYEKSVFLTLAQDQLVIAYYGGSTSVAFETNEEIRRYLEGLVKTYTCTKATDQSGSVGGTIYDLPKDLWFIVYEQAVSGGSGCFSGKAIDVVPVTHDSFNKTKGNPFRGASSKRVLRLDCGGNKVELVSKGAVSSYKIRYLSEPSPIILTELEGDVEIKGKSHITECALHPALHRKILEIAVQLALASRAKGTSDKNKQ